MTSTACCTGFQHDGEPKGRVETLHGLPTYVAEPSDNAPIKGFVVMIPDAFGWEFVNLRLLSDIFADSLGVQCLLPDLMNGTAAPLSGLMNLKNGTNPNRSYLSRIVPALKGFTTIAYFYVNNRFGTVWPRTTAFFKGLRESTDLPVGVIGYCWGGKHAICLAHGTDTTSSGKPLVDAAVTAHPSALELPGDLEKVTVPTLISQGTQDFVLDMKGVKVIQEVFEKKNKAEGQGPEGQKYDIKVIEGAMHGFAVRGDPDDKEELEQAQKGEDQAVEWFKKFLLKTA